MTIEEHGVKPFVVWKVVDGDVIVLETDDIVEVTIFVLKCDDDFTMVKRVEVAL